MKKLVIVGLNTVLAATSVPTRPHNESHHASYSAGEPVDPSEPSRTVEIEMPTNLSRSS